MSPQHARSATCCHRTAPVALHAVPPSNHLSRPSATPPAAADRGASAVSAWSSKTAKCIKKAAMHMADKTNCTEHKLPPATEAQLETEGQPALLRSVTVTLPRTVARHLG